MTDQRTGAAWVGSIEALRDYANIPATTLHDLCVFVIHGRGGGNFVGAVLENSLQRAFQHGDLPNIKALWAITVWLHNRAPRQSHGSPVIAQNWRTTGGLMGWYQGPEEIRQELIADWYREAVKDTLLEGTEVPR